MSGDQSKAQRFEIIKNLYAKQTIGSDDRMEFGELSTHLGANESNISSLIRMMRPKFVKSQTISEKRFVYLTNESFNAMDKTPQPTTYDEFVNRVDNPEKLFGDPIVVPLSRGDKFKKWLHNSWKIIRGVGIVIGIIVGIIAILKFI